MPLVTFTVHEGQLDEGQKAKAVRLFTDAAVEVEGLGEGAREATWVVVQEVPHGSFGSGGRVVGREDYERAIRARSAQP